MVDGRPNHSCLQVGLETTAIASVPVLVAWFIAFYVVPKQFRVFARKYLRTHPVSVGSSFGSGHEMKHDMPIK